MSADTLASLEGAIAEHIADEYDGDMVTAWVVVTETTSISMLNAGVGSMVIEPRPMQSNYLTQGLLHAALTVSSGSEADDD